MSERSAVSSKEYGLRRCIRGGHTLAPREHKKLHAELRAEPSCEMLAVLLAAASAAPRTELARPSRGLFDAVTRRAFTAADYDADGFINKQEIYGLVLTAYVYANRAAPIEPPSRDTIEALLARADLNRDGRLSYEEFRALAPVLGLRVTAPLAVFVAIKMLLAPILAWNVVAQLGKSERLLAFGESLTLPGVLDRLVVSDDFWRTVLTVAFMASLNNVCTMLTKALLAPMPFARALLASR